MWESHGNRIMITQVRVCIYFAKRARTEVCSHATQPSDPSVFSLWTSKHQPDMPLDVSQTCSAVA